MIYWRDCDRDRKSSSRLIFVHRPLWFKCGEAWEWVPKGRIGRSVKVSRSVFAVMASAPTTSTASTQTIPSNSKQVPTLISDLLDLAIYSFGCQSGLRSCHKIRGNPFLAAWHSINALWWHGKRIGTISLQVASSGFSWQAKVPKWLHGKVLCTGTMQGLVSQSWPQISLQRCPQTLTLSHGCWHTSEDGSK